MCFIISAKGENKNLIRDGLKFVFGEDEFLELYEVRELHRNFLEFIVREVETFQ